MEGYSENIYSSAHRVLAGSNMAIGCDSSIGCVCGSEFGIGSGFDSGSDSGSCIGSAPSSGTGSGIGSSSNSGAGIGTGSAPGSGSGSGGCSGTDSTSGSTSSIIRSFFLGFSATGSSLALSSTMRALASASFPIFDTLPPSGSCSSRS